MEEIENVLDEGFFDKARKFGSDVGAYAKGMMGSTSQERTQAGSSSQDVVNLGYRKTLKSITPQLVASLEELDKLLRADATSPRRDVRQKPFPSLAPIIKLAQEIDVSIPTTLTNEGIGDMVKAATSYVGDIASNVKGAAKDHMARGKDPLTQAIHNTRTLIFKIRKLLETLGRKESMERLRRIEDTIIDIQVDLSKAGRKTYGNR